MWMRIKVVTLLLLLSGVAAAAEETAGRVTGDKVRVRAGPGTRHAVLLEVNRDDLLVVLGREGQWSRVRVPGGFVCFVHSSLVKVAEGAAPVISASRVRLRVTAGKEILPLETVLERGEAIEILAREGEWLKIIPPARTHLYIFARYVEELGPAREYRKSLERQAAARHESHTAAKTVEQRESEELARQQVLSEDVVEMGKAVLAGEGDTGDLTARLRTITMETSDDLTRGYAESLLVLLGLRREAETLRDQLSRTDTEQEEEMAALRARVDAAEVRYKDELKRIRTQRDLRKEAFRRFGLVEKRNGTFILRMVDGRVVHLTSDRFRLSEYIGKSVGVVGRMILTDPRTGVTHLKVEKLEILPARAGGG